ncbi:MAG: precorrin-8X methylmutase, partial [Thermoplasmata archaeon]
ILSPDLSALIRTEGLDLTTTDIEKIIFVAIRSEILNDIARNQDESDRQMIEENSLSIINSLLPGNMEYPMRYIVMKAVHSSADFAIANLIGYSRRFYETMMMKLKERATIIADSEMVKAGIYSKPVISRNKVVCYLNDDETVEIAKQRGMTRSAAGIMRGLLENRNSIIVVGNAPTALDQAIIMIEENQWYDTPVIGVPVGFVNAKKVKEKLAGTSIEHFTVYGQRGGSPIAASIVNGFGRFL